ncbi:MAG: acyltransferase [Fimbriimonas sp.]
MKGIGILEVIVHHSLSHGARKFSDLHSPEWWFLRGLNRFLHFAIPLFLLVSAVLLTQSLVKRPEWSRFVKRRATRTLWPYLLWSLVFWAFRLRFLQIGSDVYTVDRTYPILGTLSGPRLLVDFPDLFRELLWGKAYFHLYFMVVLLQLALVLPLAIYALRGRRLSLSAVLGIAGATQFAAFLLQAHVLRVTSPASLVLWYIPSVLCGVWIGLDWNRWTSEWSRVRRPLFVLAATGLALYLPMSVGLELGWTVSSIAFNLAFGGFTIGISLLLLGHAPAFAPLRFGRILACLGQVSLPMFLVHPMLLYFLSGPRISGLLDRLPFSVLWLAAIVVLLSFAFGRLCVRLRADRFLFGQRLASPSPLPASA